MKDLKEGDALLSYSIKEINDQPDYQKFSWNSETFTVDSEGFTESVITEISSKEDSDIVCFNDNTKIKMTFTQPVFVKSHVDNIYRVKEAYFVEEGDLLIWASEDGSYTEVPVTKIDYYTDETRTVYQLTCKPHDWFFADGMLVHNK